MNILLCSLDRDLSLGVDSFSLHPARGPRGRGPGDGVETGGGRGRAWGGGEPGRVERQDVVSVEPGGRDGRQALQVGAGQQGVCGERLLQTEEISDFSQILAKFLYFWRF